MPSHDDPNATDKPNVANADVSAAVEDLLNSLSNKFASVSSEIFAKMDDMSRRLDKLEGALLEQKSKSSEGNGSASSQS
ncbi:hypothetical protein CDD81_3605 [Ophiocordyceps australis]|uniref:Heat shock factor binding protein 1 n=1 Tax=Ophiocordyceps australis TaxID=1399860 RepID=A0A2C5XJK6_9HYPO|nr:hypothetical protein CDD81_3605 [Ophiocordyceps australis]